MQASSGCILSILVASYRSLSRYYCAILRRSGASSAPNCVLLRRIASSCNDLHCICCAQTRQFRTPRNLSKHNGSINAGTSELVDRTWSIGTGQSELVNRNRSITGEFTGPPPPSRPQLPQPPPTPPTPPPPPQQQQQPVPKRMRVCVGRGGGCVCVCVGGGAARRRGVTGGGSGRRRGPARAARGRGGAASATGWATAAHAPGKHIIRLCVYKIVR